MSRVDPGQDQLPGPTRLRVSIIGGVSRQGTDAPECFRSAASGMRRTIAPLPVDHQHRHSQPISTARITATISDARPVRPTLGIAGRPVRSCSRALPRLGHRERGPAAGVLESLRAGADAKGPRGSLGKSGPRLGRLTSARRGTRCTAHRASASVLPAPASAPIPVSGDMVSWLACRGDVLEQMVPASGGVGALSDDIAAGDLVSAPRRRKATTGHVVANAEPLQPIERIVCDYKGPCTCDGDRCASADNRCNCNPSHDGNSRPTRMIQRGGVAKITQRKE